jgi:tRNA A-37 threonylcarbamoyl transferase component Bud32/GAF domain-containing protein
MSTDDWRQISAIFHEARAKPDVERDGFLERACGDNARLRQRVERMLRADEAAGAFGEAPLVSRAQLVSWVREHSSAEAGRRWPFLGCVLAAAVATLICFGYATWLLVAAGAIEPYGGWLAAPQGAQWRITSVAADGAAAGLLEPGDSLLLMNGTPIGPDDGLLLHRRDLEIGDTYTLTIERNGERRQLSLTMGGRPATQQLVYFAVSLVWCCVGLFIGFARPQATPARLACATSLAVGFVFLQISIIRSGLLWQPLHAVLGFHFLARFPTGQTTRGYMRAALIVAWLTGGAAAALGLFSHGTALRAGTAAAIDLINTHAGVFGLRWPLGIASFAVAVIGMIAALILNYRGLDAEDHRRRIRWVLYGALIGLVPQIWWTAVTLIESLTGITAIPRFDLLVNASTVAIPLAMAYAVVRHRVLDIRVVVRRSLQYLLARHALRIVVAIPFVALVVILIRNRDLTLGQLVTETVGYILWLALATLALRYRGPISRWLDKRFFREEFDREQLMMRLLEQSRRVESLSELSQLVSVILDSALHPSSALVWYRDPQERADTAATTPEFSAADFPAAEAFLHWLEQQGAAVSLDILEHAGVSPDAVNWLAARGIALIVPMVDSGDRLVGALFLGGRKSEQPYDANDSKLLDAVARQTGVIRENLRLRARLSEEVRVRHDVLARLDDRLPGLLRECPDCGSCYDGHEERCSLDNAVLVISLPIERTVDHRYRLDRLLGKGGMGAVYEARDLRLDRIVAIKVLHHKGLRQANALRRFRREARATARLSHPNIVTIYDFGSLDNDMAYIVMERIDGETLRATLERDGTLEPAVARAWFEPLLAGIGAAHDNGIVHRDLKPENVMGAFDEAGHFQVKLLDLGLAKLRASDQQELDTVTQDGWLIGTPDYMPPEQLLGREIDRRADIFAIGVMLTEALTGDRVRRRSLRAGLSAELPEKDLPDAMRDLLASCLAEDPLERPESAAALARRLMPLLSA